MNMILGSHEVDSLIKSLPLRSLYEQTGDFDRLREFAENQTMTNEIFEKLIKMLLEENKQRKAEYDKLNARILELEKTNSLR